MTTTANEQQIIYVYEHLSKRVESGENQVSQREMAGKTGLTIATVRAALKTLVEREWINRWRPSDAKKFDPDCYGIVGVKTPEPAPRPVSASDKQDAVLRRLNTLQAESDDIAARYSRIISHNPPRLLSVNMALANANTIAREHGQRTGVLGFDGELPSPIQYPTCGCGLAFYPKAGETMCIVCIEAAEPVLCRRCEMPFYATSSPTPTATQPGGHGAGAVTLCPDCAND